MPCVDGHAPVNIVGWLTGVDEIAAGVMLAATAPRRVIPLEGAPFQRARGEEAVEDDVGSAVDGEEHHARATRRAAGRRTSRARARAIRRMRRI